MVMELAPKVYWVGAIDWNLREFHGYLTERGSTYNAFLILDEQITLIDTVKKEFVPEMLARVAEVVDPEKISYIVSNHVEMDHSGGLPEVMARVKPSKLFCSPMGKAGLSRHYQSEWPFVEVKTGQEISLGQRTLLFLETPMLHWPDSMMTYLKEEQILFSSDAFGAHFASEERFDLETPDFPAYLHQVQKYYANILMPFGGLVLKLFQRLQPMGLEFKLIAPDHGLLLRSPGPILAAYQKWGAGEAEPHRALVVPTPCGLYRVAGPGIGRRLAGRRGRDRQLPFAPRPLQRHRSRGSGRRPAPFGLPHSQQYHLPFHGRVPHLS